jgi:hypothetical protein
MLPLPAYAFFLYPPHAGWSLHMLPPPNTPHSARGIATQGSKTITTTGNCSCGRATDSVAHTEPPTDPEAAPSSSHGWCVESNRTVEDTVGLMKILMAPSCQHSRGPALLEALEELLRPGDGVAARQLHLRVHLAAGTCHRSIALLMHSFCIQH